MSRTTNDPIPALSPSSVSAPNGVPLAPAADAPAATPASTPAGAAGVKRSTEPSRVDALPPFRVLLHNSDTPDQVYVVETLMELTPLDVHRATDVMLEAHHTGVALVLVTHRERAELYAEQFRSRRLIVTFEPAE